MTDIHWGRLEAPQVVAYQDQFRDDQDDSPRLK